MQPPRLSSTRMGFGGAAATLILKPEWGPGGAAATLIVRPHAYPQPVWGPEVQPPRLSST